MSSNPDARGHRGPVIRPLLLLFALVGVIHTFNLTQQITLQLVQELRHEAARVRDDIRGEWSAEFRAWKALLRFEDDPPEHGAADQAAAVERKAVDAPGIDGS